jgi:hypothetical protein
VSPLVEARAGTSVDLHWIPLGAGGHSVRFNGKMYEAVAAAIEHRPRLDIYHSALTVRTAGGRYVVEMTPVPNARSWERGVVAGGPVGARWAGRFPVFRYEVRRWLDGVIPDLDSAVATRRLTDDEAIAHDLLELLPSVPTAVWGRDELDAGEMWSCNSIVSRALTRSGLDTGAIRLPAHGRAPGWDAGIAVARRDPSRSRPVRDVLHDQVGTTWRLADAPALRRRHQRR